jgi:hypothetical protein
MASKVSKKSSINISGVLDISEDGKVSVLVEDCEKPFALNELFADYADKEVKISIAYGEDI